MMYVQLLTPFIIAFAIWGLVFSNILVGAIIGAAIGLVSCVVTAMALSSAKTAEKNSELIYAAVALWMPPAVIVGVIGLVVYVLKLIFKF